jgi:hypothetical protein
MMRSFRHVRMSFSRGRSARTAVALILAVVAGILVLPATASATVDKKHAKAYAAKVRMFVILEQDHRRSYNTYEESLVATANEMKPLIGSPDPNDKLGLEQLKIYANGCRESYLTDLRQFNIVYLKLVRAFYPASKDWFSQAADKTRFHRWTSRLDMGVSRSNRAFLYLSNAFLRLSEEDMEGAQAYNNQAIQLVSQAGPMVDEALDGLRALRR